MDVRSELLGLDDLVTKEVEVPVWNRKLRVRELGLLESLQVMGPDKVGDDGKITMTGEDLARVVALGVISDDGERVFTDEDIPVLAKKNRKALTALYHEILALGGSVEEAEKN
jgi:hypothetical protein